MTMLIFTMFSILICVINVYSIDYFDNDWNFKRNITITANENTPINYNVLIRLADADLGSNFDWSNSCSDIRFVNSVNGSELSYWIDDCDTVGKQLDVWIKVDKALVSAEDYIVKLFYKKSGASSVSSASSTFRENKVYLVTGYCDGGAVCDMQNHGEALTFRSNVGINGMTIHGTGFMNSINQLDNPFGANDNYFTRSRFLLIPTFDGAHRFGSRVDDDNEITIFPLDGYGSGIQTGTPYGGYDVITTQYSAWHGGGACGSNNAIEGSRSLNAGEGYWMDFITIEGGGGEDQIMCIQTGGSGPHDIFDDTNFDGQFFARDYVQNEPSVSSISSEVKNPNFVGISFNGILTAVSNKIKFEKTKTFSVDISCEGINNLDNCGTVTTSLQIDSSGYSDMPQGAGTPFNVVGTNSQTCNLNYGQSCTLNWIVNATGVVGTISDLRINSDSGNAGIIDKISQTFQAEIVAGDVVSFNTTSVTIPTFTKNSGDGSINILAVSDTGDNTNLQVACDSGDCAKIYDNFGDGLNLNEGLSSSFSFSCDDSSAGNYSASYSITSNEFTGFNYINVSCNILPLYGPISVSVDNLNYPSINIVKVNETFDVNTTIECFNNCGEISAYAILAQDPTTWWAGSSWSYRSYLNFSINENIPINYQVLAKLNETSLGNNFDWSNFCDDVRTYTNSGSSLDLWIEKCDTVGKELDLWIELDSAQSLGDNVIVELYFGNSGASSISSADDTFRNNEINWISGSCPSGQPSCNHIDNQAESDYLKQNIGTGVYTIYGESYTNQMYQNTDAQGGSTNYYYSRMRTLFIPSVTRDYGFGTDGDDGVEIGWLPNDGYGTGLKTSDMTNYERLGFWYGGHGAGTCGSSGTPGSKNLEAGVGYWIDFLHEEGSGGDSLQGCINDGSGFKRLSSANFPGQIFARNYVDSEPSLVSVVDRTNTIIPTSSDLPFWTSSPQPQTCNPVEDGSCNIGWSINATGAVNSSYNITFIISSDVLSIKENKSNNYGILISQDLPFVVNLISPVNASSFLSLSEVEFKWSLTSSYNSTLDCGFYLNSVFIQNVSCVEGEVTSFNYSVGEGIFDWQVYADNVINGNDTSDLFTFNTFKKYHSKVSKSIKYDSSNFYESKIDVENYINFSVDSVVVDFVPEGISSSYLPIYYDFFNLSSGFYSGNLYGYSMIMTPFLNVDLPVATSGIVGLSNLGNGRIEESFVIGLE